MVVHQDRGPPPPPPPHLYKGSQGDNLLEVRNCLAESLREQLREQQRKLNKQKSCVAYGKDPGKQSRATADGRKASSMA